MQQWTGSCSPESVVCACLVHHATHYSNLKMCILDLTYCLPCHLLAAYIERIQSQGGKLFTIFELCFFLYNLMDNCTLPRWIWYHRYSHSNVISTVIIMVFSLCFMSLGRLLWCSCITLLTIIVRNTLWFCTFWLQFTNFRMLE